MTSASLASAAPSTTGCHGDFAFLVEHDKKKYDVRTYREIRAFCDGASVDEIKARRGLVRQGTSVMGKILIGACVGATVGLLIAWLTRLFLAA